MKLSSAVLLAMWLSPAAGQDYKSVSPALNHVFQVTTSPALNRVFQVTTFPYPGFKGYVKLWSAQRTPKAKGKVWIARECATTIIDARVDDLPRAQSFDTALTTYVLWLISPEGKLENAGEFVLHRDGSELQTTTTLASFGMFVSAEPNCCVEAPSQFVVLVNAPTVNGIWAPGPPAIINYAPPQEVFGEVE
jgi:hypothetical protein